MSALAATYKFTVQEYYRLYEAGVLEDRDRIELLNGELIIMHPIGERHAQAMTNVASYLAEQMRRRFMISPQNPVELDQFSAPQPDLVLVPWARKSKRHPTPAEVFLIVEISDTSLRYDRGDKLHAYAAVGIREFWIVNLEADTIEIYRQPEGVTYREQLVVPLEGTASPLAFPDVSIAVADIIPPR